MAALYYARRPRARSGPDHKVREGKASFCEQKEAKKLYLLWDEA
jgi:hypothetical protein